MIRQFINLCAELKIPIAVDKTVWAGTQIVFLGILLDGERLMLSLPLEKQEKALKLLNEFMDRKKATIHQIQVLTGYLNFLTKAIAPGRTFTRRMYAKAALYEKGTCNAKPLKPYHHMRIDAEFRFDCEVWQLFLLNFRNAAVCREMVDFDRKGFTGHELSFYLDASANPNLGFGAVHNDYWLYGQWELGYIRKYNPSIEYLELFALTAALLTWGDLLRNMQIIIFCDNEAVVQMVNSQTSSCKNCMYLIWLLILNNLVNNQKVSVRHVRSENNELSDALSHLQFKRFWRLVQGTMHPHPSMISQLVWPVLCIWQQFK